MLIYFVVFFASIALLFFAYHIKGAGQLKKLISVAGLILPCVLAGLRADVVGTDVLWYVKRFFDYSLQVDSLNELILLSQNTDSEIGYWIWTYIIAKITRDFHWFLFFTEFFIMIFVYKGIKLFEAEFKSVMPILFFFLIFYNMSYNIVRQSMAMSIVFYSVCLLWKTGYKRSMLLILVALFFHRSAVIGLVMYAFYYMGRNKIIMRYQLVFFILIILFAISYKRLLEFFVTHTVFLPQKYIMHFLDQQANMTGFSIVRVILFVMPMLIVLLLAKKMQKELEINSMGFIALLSIVLNCLNTGSFGRVVYYFDFFTILIFMPLYLKRSVINSKFVRTYVLVSFTAYWYWFYIIMNYCETYPYIVYWSK